MRRRNLASVPVKLPQRSWATPYSLHAFNASVTAFLQEAWFSSRVSSLFTARNASSNSEPPATMLHVC